jgi:hypothetical protein
MKVSSPEGGSKMLSTMYHLSGKSSSVLKPQPERRGVSALREAVSLADLLPAKV